MSPRPSRRARVLLLLAAAVPLLVAGGWHLAVWIALRSPLGVSPASVAAAIPRATRLYTRDGDLLYEFAEERRTWVPLDQVSPRLVEAVLAVEDEHFREHSGIRWSAMVRAMVANLRAGGFVQGGSTITQQVARNLFLTREKSLWRKLSEMILARRLEAELTKDEILEIYLNMVYWGEGAWGVEEAARTFFCASAGTLDEAQSALLAGLIAAPARLSPIAHPERARQRFEHVRRRLGDEGLPYPGIAPCPRHRLELAPHTAVRVRTWLLRTLGEEAFARGGQTVRLTLDARVQQALAEGVRRTLEARGPGSAAWPRFRILHEAPSPPPEGCRVTSGQPLWVLVEGEPDAKGMLPVSWRGRHGVLPLEALALDLAGFEPPRPGEGEVILATPAEELDSCSPWEGDPRIFVPVASPQLAVVAVDASTGEVLGSVGGVGSRYHPFDRAFDARRSAGSTVKPLVYLAAAERLGWGADSPLPEDLPARFRGRDGLPWAPAEPHPLPRGAPLTVRTALERSLNRPAVGVLATIGLPEFREDWKRYGGPAVALDDLSVALGTMALSPVDLAGLYSIFPGKGKAPRPFLVETVLDRDGAVLYQARRGAGGHAERAAAVALARALRAVVDEGTGRGALPRALKEGHGYGGKTGTSEGGRDAWFVGWVDHVVVAAWVGCDDNTPLERASGAALAMPLWRAAMEEIEAAGLLR